MPHQVQDVFAQLPNAVLQDLAYSAASSLDKDGCHSITPKCPRVPIINTRCKGNVVPFLQTGVFFPLSMCNFEMGAR